MSEVAVKVEIMVPDSLSGGNKHHPSAENKTKFSGKVPSSTSVEELIVIVARENKPVSERVFDPESRSFQVESMVIYNQKYLSREQIKTMVVEEDAEIFILPVPFGG